MPTDMSSKSFLQTTSAHGATPESILNSDLNNVNRDLDVVEFFAGVGSIYNAALKCKLAAARFDKEPTQTQDGPNIHCEDITTKRGFEVALRLTMRLRKDALMTMAPQCSSFIQMNAKNCKRKFDNAFLGDENYEPVRLGNIIFNVVCVLLLVAHARGVHVVVENPPGSYFWKLQPLKAIMAILKMSSALVPRCSYATRKRGLKIGKKSDLFARMSGSRTSLAAASAKRADMCCCIHRRQFEATLLSQRCPKRPHTRQPSALR